MLSVAASRGHVDVCRLLLGHGASASARNASVGLCSSCQRLYMGFVVGVSCRGVVLVNPSFDPGGAYACTRFVVSQHATPLHRAAWAGSDAVVSLLLAVDGLDVNSAKPNGETPLHLAAFQGHASVVTALLGAGADVDAAKSVCSGSALPSAPMEPHSSVWCCLSVYVQAARHHRVACGRVQGTHHVHGCHG